MKEWIFCKERQTHCGSYYYTKGVGLTINCNYKGTIGYFIGWELAIAPNQTFNGNTKEELLAKLHELWPDLKWHSEKTKDKVMIMTDNINKVIGFFEKNITERFEDFYCTLDEFFEVRPCDRWMDESTALGIAQQAQKVIDEYFIPEKYFYITPQQRNRKFLAKQKGTDYTADLSYPKSFESYTQMRKGYFSGLLYKPFTGMLIEEPMLVLDITSSYIFDLLICKHVISERKRIKDLSVWEYYLSSANKASLGMYKVKYSAPRSFVSCFTDFEGNKLEAGEHDVVMVLTSVDLKNLLDLGYVQSCEPVWLYEYQMGEIPKYFMDELVKSYIAKATAKDKKEKAIRKPILNGWYGDTIRKWDEDSFDDTRKNPALSPLWGIFTTAYAKKYLLKLALKVDGWYYSDTDSIICKDTKQNRALLAAFNDEIRDMVKDFCDAHGYDYEILKDLGTFKIEAEIDKLKVWACKTYVYRHTDGQVTLKAAGLVKSRVEVNEKLFTLKELDYTKTVFPLVVPASQSKTGEGYYVEISPENRAQYYVLIKLLQDHNKILASK